MTQIDILSGVVGSYSDEAFDSTEKLIRDHRDAMACDAVEEGINLLLFTFHGLARFAYRLSNLETPSYTPPDWPKVFEVCLLLREKMRQQIGLLPDCEELGFLMERGDELKWAFDRLEGLWENLKDRHKVDEDIMKAFEDFSDVVESDKVRMDPTTEFIPWKAARF